MNDEIGTCKRALECASILRTFEHTFLLLVVLGFSVEFKSGGMKELLIAHSTCKWQISLVLLQVIMHRVLIFSCLTTMLTHEKTIVILCIDIDHFECQNEKKLFQFFGGGLIYLACKSGPDRAEPTLEPWPSYYAEAFQSPFYLQWQERWG